MSTLERHHPLMSCSMVVVERLDHVLQQKPSRTVAQYIVPLPRSRGGPAGVPEGVGGGGYPPPLQVT